VIDPRSKDHEGELAKQFELSTKVNQRISELHQAVNEIRDIKSQIKALHTKFEDDAKVKPALETADAMEHKMSEVEQQLVQVNMKGSEGNLAFPNMLNEAFDTFSRSVDSGDREPTKPQMDVFASLSGRLDEQLKKWNAIKQDELPKVSAMIKQADLPSLIIKENKEG
jgi:seryl-tRNA synthetase